MPTIDNSGVAIHYEVEGSKGPVVVMVHGMGMSAQDWYRAGYVETLREEYRLLIIDSRGFGQSGKPPDPEAYGRREKVSDITAVMNAEGVNQAHYWGFSMGASIGWAMGMLAPKRVRSLIIAAYPVLPAEVTPSDRLRWESRAKLMRLGMDVYVTATEMHTGPMEQDARERLLANDGMSYAAQQIANLSWGAPDDDIRRMTLPTFVYTGTEDKDVMPTNHELTVRTAGLAPNATLLQIPGYKHMQTFNDSAFIIPHIRKWITRIEAEAR